MLMDSWTEGSLPNQHRKHRYLRSRRGVAVHHPSCTKYVLSLQKAHLSQPSYRLRDLFLATAPSVTLTLVKHEGIPCVSAKLVPKRGSHITPLFDFVSVVFLDVSVVFSLFVVVFA